MVHSETSRSRKHHDVRWESLPHVRLASEIAQVVAYRAPQEAHYEMRLEELAQKLPQFSQDDHSEFTRLISAETNRELRICRDVYRNYLETLNNKSRIAKWDVALNFAVAPRASLILRRRICAYLETSRVDPIIAETFLAFRAGLVIPLRGAPIRPVDAKRSMEEVVCSCVPAGAFQDLKERFKRENFIVGGPFAPPHILRRAMSYGISLADISPILEDNQVWISGAACLWDNVLREIVAQRVQIDLEERSNTMVAVESLPKFDRIVGPLYGEASERYTTIPREVWETIGERVDVAGISLEGTLEPKGKRVLRDLLRRQIAIKTWREALICDRDFGVLESKVVVNGNVKYRGMLNRHAKRAVYRARDRYRKLLEYIYEERIRRGPEPPS